MYASILEIGRGFFEGACTLRHTSANFRDPPPPRNTKTGATLLGLWPKEGHAPGYRGRRLVLG
jgi:hypothetical protein